MTAQQVSLAVLLFVGTTVLTLIGGAFFVVRLPADYFVAERRPSVRGRAARVVLLVLKNLVGLVLVVVGALLSIPGIPGQGFLTIFLGILLLDFPGKHRLERRVLGNPRALAAINRIRASRGRPPLVPPPGPSATTT